MSHDPHTSEPHSSEPGTGEPHTREPGTGEPGDAGRPPYAPLADALTRAVSTAPWWRRWFAVAPGKLAPGELAPGKLAAEEPAAGKHARAGRRRRLYPVAGALGAVLVLSLLGIAAPWDRGTSPARGDGTQGPIGPVLLSPTTTPADPRSIDSRQEPGQASDRPSCPAPLSVIAAPDISGLVQELAGPLAGGDCPQLTINPEAPATTLSALAAGDADPDVWIPDSSLWLRLAGSERTGLPAAGTSIARTPVVMAVPEPVADQLTSEGAWPVWLVYYDRVTAGGIPRMSMAGPDTTVGALTLVAFAAAAEYHWGDDAEGAVFLHTIHFRDSLATTDADPAALLDRLAGTPAAQSATQVGMFPVTEQRLLSYQDAHPGLPAVALGTHEAMSEADYPVAVSGSLTGRPAEVAGELLARLRSAEAVERLVELGFRPPRGSSTQPAVLADTGRFPAYPDPVALPDRAGWQAILDTWTWTG